MDDDKAKQLEHARRQMQVVELALAAAESRQSLIKFMQFIMPDPNRADEPTASLYKVGPHHKLLAESLEELFAGKNLRLCISVGPQHGKSQIASRGFPSWVIGRQPHKNIMLGTYNQDFANEFGSDVRDITTSARFKLVFPEFDFRSGSKAKDHMVTHHGGKLSFLGRGGSGTGRPADLFLIDDPIKDAKEAESATIRNDVWEWFTKVAYTRCHAASAIAIIQCMTGDTPVLMADGTEKPLKDIKVGDEIATFKNGELATSFVMNWANNGPDSVFEITTASGKTVKANERHPFLVNDNGNEKWIRMKNLSLGQEIYLVNGESGLEKLANGKGATSRCHAGATAHRITTKNDGLTGFVRRLQRIVCQGAMRTLSIGTGLLLKNTKPCLRRKVECAQSAEASKEKTFQIIGTENCALTTATNQEKSEGFFATTVTLLSDMQKRLKSLSRQRNTSDFILDKIVKIEFCGEEEVFDIQVAETENFIANGLVSHNTRWHDDDLIGRLTDPSNPYYNAEEAARWTYINIPTLFDDPRDKGIADALGIQMGEPLWPERFSKDHLLSARRLNPIGFSALYQGRPTPPDGAFYKTDMFHGYASASELPKNLMVYGSGDLAVSPDRDADSSVVGNWGVDKDGVAWLLPDLYWAKKAADETVEQLIDFADRHKWLTFAGEKGVIDRAIGPFLNKRMQERQKYFHIEKFPTVGNKAARSLSIRGRMVQGKVRFPTFAPWWPAAREQMLKFTGSGGDREDDFCDMLGLFGQLADVVLNGQGNTEAVKKDNVVPIGTLRWIKEQDKSRREHERRTQARKGF